MGEGETVVKRDRWANKLEFILATLGYCIGKFLASFVLNFSFRQFKILGIGAITRFPYLAVRNGGGAFLIPFMIGMVLAGAPLFYLEIILGQFSGKSPLALWKPLCPSFRGLGLSTTLLSAFFSLWYMPLPYSLFYLVKSFNTVLPWGSCGNEWNTER